MANEGYRFSKEQLNTARNVDLGAFLLFIDPDRYYTDKNGYVRDKQFPKFKVDKKKKNQYYMNDDVEKKFGNSIDYFEQFVGFVKAVDCLLAFANGTASKMSIKETNATTLV